MWSLGEPKPRGYQQNYVKSLWYEKCCRTYNNQDEYMIVDINFDNK